MINSQNISNSQFDNSFTNLIMTHSCDQNDNINSLQIKAYEAFKSSDYDTAICLFKQINSKAQSQHNLEFSCEALLNLSIMYFYSGKIPKAYHFLTESYDLCNSLINKDKGIMSIPLNRIYLRILSNFTMINISMNLCDNSLSTFDTIIDYIGKIADSVLKNEMFNLIIKNFFLINPNKGNSTISYSGMNLLLERADNNFEFNYSSDVFLMIKSLNLIFFGFLQFLKNEKGLDYFVKCQQEAISNLNILSENCMVSVPLVNLSLLKIMKSDTQNSKDAFKDFYKVINSSKKKNYNSDNDTETDNNNKIEMETTSNIIDDENIENTYSKIINEQFQKFETAKIIYDNLINFYPDQGIENITNDNTSNNEIIFTLILKRMKNDLIIQNNIENSDNNNNNEENKSENNLSSDRSIVEEIKKIDISLELLKDFENSKLLKLDDPSFIDIENYYLGILKNMKRIYKKNKLKKYFKIFLKRTLIYENIKDYRNYVKRSIVEPQLKKYYYRCLDNFKNIGYSITKFNFSTSGKKDKYMKFNINEEKLNSRSEIIFSTNRKYTENIKKINLDEISNIVYGVNTINLKNKYSEFQKETYKKPWLFISFILKTKTKPTNKIKNKNNEYNKSYSSIDVFLQNDDDLKEIIFSLNLIKYLFGLINLKIISNMNFLLQKMKYKMIFSAKSNSKKKEDTFLIENTWSFTKLFLFMVKNKIKIIEN